MQGAKCRATTPYLRSEVVQGKCHGKRQVSQYGNGNLACRQIKHGWEKPVCSIHFADGTPKHRVWQSACKGSSLLFPGIERMVNDGRGRDSTDTHVLLQPNHSRLYPFRLRLQTASEHFEACVGS